MIDEKNVLVETVSCLIDVVNELIAFEGIGDHKIKELNSILVLLKNEYN